MYVIVISKYYIFYLQLIYVGDEIVRERSGLIFIPKIVEEVTIYRGRSRFIETIYHMSLKKERFDSDNEI